MNRGSYKKSSFRKEVRGGKMTYQERGTEKSSPVPEKLYRKIHECLPIACVDVIIKTPDSGLVMFKRKTKPAQGQWWFVGGRVFKNERLEDAARRKVKEEAGISVKKVQLVGSVYETIFQEDPFGHGKGTHTLNVCFITKISAQQLAAIRLNTHHSAFRVFYRADSSWHPYLQQCLRDCEGKYD